MPPILLTGSCRISGQPGSLPGLMVLTAIAADASSAVAMLTGAAAAPGSGFRPGPAPIVAERDELVVHRGVSADV
jgi:hypothetical protein